MKKLTIGFAGTPDFAALFLEQLQTNSSVPLTIKFVLTQEDKPVGRKQILTPSPVKVIAQRHALPVVHDFEAVSTLLERVELVLVFAYGEFIPPALLTVPRLGWWNIHPSLLPLYRGPSPTAYPLMLGDTETGITLIQLDEKMDHGPIIAQEKIMLESSTTREELEGDLPARATDLFLRVLTDLEEQTSPQMVEQVHDQATITRLMKRDHGFIPFEILQQAIEKPINMPDEDLPILLKEYIQKYPKQEYSKTNSALVIYNYWRALHPWPGIWTEKDGKRIKIISCEIKEERLHITAIQLDGRPISENKEQIMRLFRKGF
jgi:methionyl-tRNA formyltransferase